MASIHLNLPDGGFVAGDTKTGRTIYAYPSSSSATIAQDIPSYVADALLADENRCGTDRDTGRGAEFDARNWGLLRATGLLADVQA